MTADEIKTSIGPWLVASASIRHRVECTAFKVTHSLELGSNFSKRKEKTNLRACTTLGSVEMGKKKEVVVTSREINCRFTCCADDDSPNLGSALIDF